MKRIRRWTLFKHLFAIRLCSESKGTMNADVSMPMSTNSSSTSADATDSRFDGINFDNKAIRSLPIDPCEDVYPRTVAGACFSRVKPSPVQNPQVVAYSLDALKLIDVHDESKNPRLAEYLSGNKIFNGSQPAAHCYCGHQFGSFAGQLGDGAAIYLGEIINRANERWELQLKGAGLTPYSRQADGRKVLRSSIREFLCSEAMYYLGVPTTRSGSCITSDTKVRRDIFYDGHPINERATVISRIAPTFIRFGSFEIFKTMDERSGRRGPSVGQIDILKQLTNYVVETFYPDVHDLYKNSDIDRYKAFYTQVVERTASMAAHWQCVGFCHGVLNTDNMSILGLTIDYGPFGFMDRYNPDHICNASDDGGRYTYIKQPEICKWNLGKLAEALKPILPLAASNEILDEVYQKTFDQCFNERMSKKFGLIKPLVQDSGNVPTDAELTKAFFNAMEKTGGDFTNCFRNLNLISLPDLNDFDETIATYKNKILSDCCSSLDEIIEDNESDLNNRQFQIFLILMQSNPNLLTQMGVDPKTIERNLQKLEINEQLREMSPESKRSDDDRIWSQWIELYAKRLKHDVQQFNGCEEKLRTYREERVEIMNNNNPHFVLRNYLAQNAITLAENGDYSEVRRLFEVLQKPYSQAINLTESVERNATKDDNRIAMQGDSIYDAKPPPSSRRLKVT